MRMMSYAVVVLFFLSACRRGESKSGEPGTAMVLGNRLAGDLVERPWTVKGGAKSSKQKPADTIFHFSNDNILVKTYRVEDSYSSRGFRTRKEIMLYHLSGDTLVHYNGAPVKGVIRALNDSSLVIDYPGYTARLQAH